MRLVPMLFVGVLACTSTKDDASDDTGGSDTNGEDSGVTEASPVVTGVGFATCGPDTDDVDMWSVSINVVDPQGDLASIGSTVTVLDGSTELGVYDLACGGSSCSGSWSGGTDGVDCDVGEASVFRFVAVDELGNVSAPFDYTPPV